MEQKTALERVSTAMVASNLKLEEERCPLDYVIATGMVAQKQPDAGAVIRYNAIGDLASYKQVRAAAMRITSKLNVKRNWKLSRDSLVRISDAAVKMYLMPRCSKCNGRKYQTVEGVPHLSARACPKCRGSGMRNYPMKDEAHIRDVVQVLISIVDVAEKAIIKKSRNN